MTNYIPINSVLTRIPNIIRETLGDDLILSYAMDLYKTVNVADKLQTSWAIVQLKNFTVELDKDIVSINRVYKTKEKLTNNICGDTIDSECINKIEECEECYLEKLRYTGNRNNILNHRFRNCNNCTDTFNIDSNKILTSSLKDELLLISYNTEIIEDEYYMIIDNSDLLVSLSLFCQAQYYLHISASENINNINIYTDLLNKSQILLTKFKGSRKLSNTNPDTISEISGDLSTNRRLISAWKTISRKV